MTVLTTRTTHRRVHSHRWWVALIVLILGASIWVRTPIERLLYGAYRQGLIWQTEWHLSGDHQVGAPHFVVYYPPGHRNGAEEILQLASRAYSGEITNLGIHPQGRLVIALYSTQAALNRAVGLSPHQNNIGFYWHGVIDVLGPNGLSHSLGVAHNSYPVDGPVPHELGHALLNLGADGNYPAWFNEGIAQWEDYQQTGYQWLTPHNYLGRGPLYSYRALSHHFYQLPHQSLAYREGFGLVGYLAHLGGANTLPAFIQVLGEGTSFNTAVRTTYGAPIQIVFARWQKSLHHA